MNRAKEYDLGGFKRYTKKSEFDKTIHVLDGLIHGIAIDNKINDKELSELEHWIESHAEYSHRPPFSDFINVLNEVISQKQISSENKKDILWLCKNFKSENYFFDMVTSDIQRLHGLVHGILSDNIITDEETLKLNEWIEENSHLEGFYPYDEIRSILFSVLQNNVITEDERKIMLYHFSDFIDTSGKTEIDVKKIKDLKSSINLVGIFAFDPKITIRDKHFCVTGKCKYYTRDALHKEIRINGGIVSDDINSKTDYLVVGSEGNKCWAFSCYGRKIEEAMYKRREGGKILIIKEADLQDKIESLSLEN